MGLLLNSEDNARVLDWDLNRLSACSSLTLGASRYQTTRKARRDEARVLHECHTFQVAIWYCSFITTLGSS
jgi:hypothetical protein